MKFRIQSPFKPSGDQPEAIDQLCSALNDGVTDVTPFVFPSVPESEQNDTAVFF